MVRAAPLAALAVLCGCEKPESTAVKVDGHLAQTSVEHGIEIERLKREIAEIKNQREFDKRYLDAVAASLTEARENHTALRKVVNENVDNRQPPPRIYRPAPRTINLHDC